MAQTVPARQTVQNMTEGSPVSLILRFALPIFISQVFQQLYSTADAFIVGKYLGTNAFAAVSSSGTLIMLLTSLFIGTAMGAGVAISKYFGAGDYENVSRAVHTNLAFGIVSGTLLTLIGVFLTPTFLVWMNTDAQVLSQNGAEPNAFTSNAMTGYYFDCTEHFEENLRILLSFVSVPYFTDESVEKERGIIGQEIRMVEDSPDWQVYERLLACLYRSSPARVPIAGTVESIAGITAETLYDCHHAFYCPSNMALCVVGNVDPHTVIALAEEVLPRERGEEIARCYGEEEDDAAAQKETVTQMEVALPQFLVGFKCETNEGDLLRQSLIGEMASDVLLGDSSPLYQRLYDEGLINSSFGGGFDQLPGVAVLCAGGESEQPRQVSDAILEEAQRLAREGIDPDFFEQIRRASFGATLRALNSFENIAISMADGYFRGFDALRFPEAYASIEKADVERFLRENLTDSRRAISIIEPKKEG